MKNYFLLEVGVEELPSRFVESTLTQIKENLEKSLKENRVEFENIEKYGTLDKFGYKDFIPQFKAEKFDPKEWAELVGRIMEGKEGEKR